MNDQKPIEERFPKYTIINKSEHQALHDAYYALKAIEDRLQAIILLRKPSTFAGLRLMQKYSNCYEMIRLINEFTADLSGQMYIIDGAKPYEETVTKFENKES